MRPMLALVVFLLVLALLSSHSFSYNFIVRNVSDSSKVYFIVNGTTGKIGIGMTSPSFDLDVNGTGNFLEICLSGDCVRTWEETNNITGVGQANYIPLWYNESHLVSSIIYQNGSNIGIGTTSPAGSLEIASAGDVNLTLSADTDNANEDDNPAIIFKQDGGSTYLVIGVSGNADSPFSGISSNTPYIAFLNSVAGGDGLMFAASSSSSLSSASPVMLVTPDGKLGLGTTSPVSQIHAVGGAGNLLVEDTSADQALKLGRWGIQAYNTSQPPFYGVVHYTTGGTNELYLGGGSTLGQSATHIFFYTAPNVNYVRGELRMTITGSGNVGIGTSAPTYKLQVNGSANLNDTLFVTTSGNVGIGTASPGSIYEGVGTKLEVVGDGHTSITVDSPSDFVSAITLAEAGDSKWHLLSRGNADDRFELWAANGTTGQTGAVIAVLQNGNVGIGTTNPEKKLHISGGRVKVENINDQAAFDLYTYSDINYASAGNFRRARGTPDNPQPLQAGDTLGYFGFGGYDGVQFTGSRAYFLARAPDNWNTTSQPTEIKIATTEIGRTTAETRIYISHDGRIGIGTTSPTSLLTISGGGGSTKGIALVGASTVEIYPGSLSPDAGFITFGDGTGWKFHIAKRSDGGATKFVTIQDNGNVGIGTNNPSYKLDVTGDIRSTGTLFGNVRGALVSQTSFTVPAATEKWVRIAQSPTNAARNSGLFQVRWYVGGQHGHVMFYAGADYGDANGVRLTVISADRYGDQGVDRIRILENGTYDQMYVEIYVDNNNGASTMTVYVDQITRGTNGWDLITPTDGSIPSGYTSHEIDANTAFAVNENSKIFTIEESGNVGIGTTAPAEKLDVNGSIQINSGSATGSNTVKGLRVIYAADNTEVSTTSSSFTLVKSVPSVIFDSTYGVKPRYINYIARIRSTAPSESAIIKVSLDQEGTTTSIASATSSTTSTTYAIVKNTIDVTSIADGVYDLNVYLRCNPTGCGGAYNKLLEIYFVY